MVDTYKARVRCSNCEEDFVIEVPKGSTIEEHVNTDKCKNCGCQKLRRADSQKIER